MEDLCTSCLCSGRKLYSIFDTRIYDLYTQILNEIPWYTMSSQVSINICWECRSVLHKYLTFKHQAQSSFVELLRHLNQATTPTAKETRLNTHHIINLSCPGIKLEPFSEEDADKSNIILQNNIYDFCFNNQEEYNAENDKMMDALNTSFENKDENEEVNENDNIFDSINAMNFIPNGSVLKNEHTEYNNEYDETIEFCENTFVDVCKEDWGRKKKVKKKDSKKKAKLKRKKKGKALNLEEQDSGSELPLIEYKKINNVDNDKECAQLDNKEESQIDTPVELKLAKPPRLPRDKEKLEDKPTCGECGKKFSSKKTYRYHVRVLHRGQNKHNICPRCGKVYQWKSNLGRHMRSHKARDSGELYCETCDKRFSSVATFRQHLKISRQHISETDFSFMCNECGKKFISKTRLRDHIDWEHLKKIKFKCELCDKPFKCYTSLYIHIKNVHVDEKQKKLNLCHVCGKAYQNPAKLKDHIVAMHSAETPHRCRECGAAFGWYSSLYRHLREQHQKITMALTSAERAKRYREKLKTNPEKAGGLDNIKLQPNKKKPRKTKIIVPMLLV